ncbi:ficolin-2-like [Argopecten irradians]|uniref:ficolin-2-like n=1 Tax=Argopecten irradians TaxID=31199 RepID=UPI003715E5FB
MGIKRICSRSEDYMRHRDALKVQLRKRGYSGKQVDQQLQKVDRMERPELLTKHPTNCRELRLGSPSGVYNVTLTPGRIADVYCDMDADGGPWTVIHNRQNGDVDFYRNWAEYKQGFGDLRGNFWAGRDNIHLLTQTGSILRIQLMSWYNDTGYAQYSNFSVGDESSKYRLSISGFSGNVLYDAMEYVDGYPFSTYDNDNDAWIRNCAAIRHGAWWFEQCSYSHLKGPYVRDTGVNRESMYRWEFYSGRHIVPMMKSRMMVKQPCLYSGQTENK